MSDLGAAALERFSERVERVLGERAAATFVRCMANTLRHAVRPLDDGTTFVVTGDIPAMWLRDSAAQVRPYLHLSRDDEGLQELIRTVLARQWEYVLIDPYANAFNAAPDGRGHHTDVTELHPSVWERKYEVDSLCYPLQLAYLFWQATGRTDHFDARFTAAADLIITTWSAEQDHDRSPYRFERHDGPASDTLSDNGRGPRVAVTGMTWSGFRPSDDACAYGYNVPGNMFAGVVLGQLDQIAREVLRDEELARRARVLRTDIDSGLAAHATVAHPRYGRIYAYEVDGLGGVNLMDDANVPSLLSLPLLGCLPADDPVYLATRRFVLSPDNPYFYSGAAARGVGSPHTPDRHVWPIALAVQGLTSTDPGERRDLIETLCATDAGTGLMHESFDCDRPDRYTREWFSWANAMYSELVIQHCGLALPVPGLALPHIGERAGRAALR